MIPMLNPDGVANGHYRMDIFNQNLNRFYIKPEPFQQPSAFAVKILGEYYSS
jgi:murein tripeptide amidase MpaA